MTPYRYASLWLGLWVAAATVAQVGHAADAAMPQDKAVPGWYMGMPIILNAITPKNYGGAAPNAPVPGVTKMNVYLTGPVRDDVAFAEDRWIPLPTGKRFLPAHQDTLAQFPTKARPFNAMGNFVVMGPKGNAENVKLRDKDFPANASESFPGAPLAYEIKIGPMWVKLNSHIVIEYGVKAGLLKVVPFEYGGLMWATLFDEPPFEALPTYVAKSAAEPKKMAPIKH